MNWLVILAEQIDMSLPSDSASTTTKIVGNVCTVIRAGHSVRLQVFQEHTFGIKGHGGMFHCVGAHKAQRHTSQHFHPLLTGCP